MRARAKITAALLVATVTPAAGTGLGVAASAGGTDPAGVTARSLAGVKLAFCGTGDTAAERAATFHGRMRRVRGTRRMWMRFTLKERVGEGSWRKVRAPGLGRWRKSRRGVRRFGYRQRVEGLVPGAAYRTVVRFRWYGRRGKLLRTARRRSPVCRQDAGLPNLRVVRLRGRATADPGVAGYGVRVVNSGPAPATDVGVRLAVDGAAVGVKRIASLAAGQAQTVWFLGPRCERRVSGRADPGGAIEELSEADNARSVACSQLF